MNEEWTRDQVDGKLLLQRELSKSANFHYILQVKIWKGEEM